VADGIDHRDPGPVQPEGVDLRTGPRVRSEQDRDAPGHLREGAPDRRQRFDPVDVRRPVKGEHGIPATVAEGTHALRRRELSIVDPRQAGHEIVDHHVAHEEDLLRCHALGAQVANARFLGDEEEVADGVGEFAVDLLGHRHVEGAQPRLHVRHLHAHLLCRERAGDRGVHIAHNDDPVGPILLKDLLEGDHDPGRLLRVASRPTSRWWSGFGIANSRKKISDMFSS